jgi:hypothetical protein
MFSSTGAESSPGVTAVSVKLSAHTVRGCARARIVESGAARARIPSATSPARCLLCLLATPRPGPQATVRRVQHAGPITLAAATVPMAQARPLRNSNRPAGEVAVCSAGHLQRGLHSLAGTLPLTIGLSALSAALSGAPRDPRGRGGGRGGMRGARAAHRLLEGIAAIHPCPHRTPPLLLVVREGSRVAARNRGTAAGRRRARRPVDRCGYEIPAAAHDYYARCCALSRPVCAWVSQEAQLGESPAMAELAALLDTANGGPAFEQLVATLTSADNVQRGAAEKVYEQCKEHPPQCTQQLTRVLRTSANTQARGLAAVLLRKVRRYLVRAPVRSRGPCRHWRPRGN